MITKTKILELDEVDFILHGNTTGNWHLVRLIKLLVIKLLLALTVVL